MHLYYFRIVGAVATQLRIKVGADIIPARITACIVPGTVYPMWYDAVVPVIVLPVKIRISKPGIVKGMNLMVYRRGDL
jgi:hypothetical protein